MATADAPVSQHHSRETLGPRWWGVVLVGAIAACLGVLVGYLLFAASQTDETRTGRTDVTSEEIDQIADLLGAYEAAWNAHDADAIQDTLTDEFLLEGYTSQGTQRALGNLLNFFVDEDAQTAFLGDPLVTRTEGSASGGYDVSALWVETWLVAGQEQVTHGISNYRVLEQDGELKIHRANPSPTWFQY